MQFIQSSFFTYLLDGLFFSSEKKWLIFIDCRQKYLFFEKSSIYKNTKISHLLILFLPFTLSIFGLAVWGRFDWILAFFLAFLAYAFFCALSLLLVLLNQSFPCIFSLILVYLSVINLLTLNICLSDLYISTK